MSQREIQQVEVVMGTRRYLLRGTDPEALKALAARVDGTLGEIAGPNGDRDDFKVAVLAALNIAADDEEQRAAWLEKARELARDARAAEAELAAFGDGLGSRGSGDSVPPES